MPRPAAGKRRLTERRPQAQPRAKAYVVWDTLQRGLAIRVQPTGARAWKVIYSRVRRRAGCIWAMPASSGWPTPARWRRRPCWRSPAARTRRPRSGPSAAPAPSPSWPPLCRGLRQAAQQELAAGRHPGAALPAAEVGQAAGREHHPRRRPRPDGRIEAPVLANQVLAAASAIFSWAVKQEIVAANPCRGIERNATRSRERILSEVRGADVLDRVRRRRPRRRLRPQDDPAHRPAPRRGRPHAARAHRRRLVGDAGRTRSRRWAGPAPRTARAIGCGCRSRCRTSWRS